MMQSGMLSPSERCALHSSVQMPEFFPFTASSLSFFPSSSQLHEDDLVDEDASPAWLLPQLSPVDFSGVEALSPPRSPLTSATSLSAVYRPLSPSPFQARPSSSSPPSSSPPPTTASTKSGSTSGSSVDSSDDAADRSSRAKRVRVSTPASVDSDEDAEERNRRTHREIDADRRHKESAAVRRLEQLTGIITERRTKRGKVRKSTAARKLAVLQASAEKIEELQALVDRMATASNAREERVHEVAQYLQGVADNARSRRPLPRGSSTSASGPSSFIQAISPSLRFLDDRNGLYNSFFHGGQLAMLLLNLERPIELGQLMDANRMFCDATGWRRPTDVWRPSDRGTVLPCYSYDDIEFKEQYSDPELHRVVASRKEEQAEALYTYGRIKQYPGSLQLHRELAQGVRATFQAPWRCTWSSGDVYEVPCFAWVVSSERVCNAEGKWTTRPTRAIAAWSPYDARKVEMPCA